MTPEGTVTASYDDQDRLLNYGDFDLTYTANGELLTKTDTSTGDMWSYEYDVRGNLVRVDLPDGRVIEYLVDGRNRRVGKLVDGVLVKQWLWMGQYQMAAELDGEGNLLSRFVYGEKSVTTPQLVIQDGSTYRVLADHLGSVRALVNVDDAGDVPVMVEYDAFGTPSGIGVGIIPQGFAGGHYDVDTGLVRFGARDYDAVVGRWTAKDGSRFVGGTNLFGYAANDPVNYVDPIGTWPFRSEWELRETLLDTLRQVGCYLSPYDCAKKVKEEEEEEKKFPPKTWDKTKHCVVSCEIADQCGVPISAAAGVGKEIQDVFGPGNAEIDDLGADYSGLACGSDDPIGDCKGCCSQAGYR